MAERCFLWLSGTPLNSCASEKYRWEYLKITRLQRIAAGPADLYRLKQKMQKYIVAWGRHGSAWKWNCTINILQPERVLGIFQCETGHLRYGRNRTPSGTGGLF